MYLRIRCTKVAQFPGKCGNARVLSLSDLSSAVRTSSEGVSSVGWSVPKSPWRLLAGSASPPAWTPSSSVEETDDDPEDVPPFSSEAGAFSTKTGPEGRKKILLRCDFGTFGLLKDLWLSYCTVLPTRNSTQKQKSTARSSMVFRPHYNYSLLTSKDWKSIHRLFPTVREFTRWNPSALTSRTDTTTSNGAYTGQTTETLGCLLHRCRGIGVAKFLQ